MSKKQYQVRLSPIDPILFGDNRLDSQGVYGDQDPSPLTIYGTIGQWLIQQSANGFPDAILGHFQPDILNPVSDCATLKAVYMQDTEGGLWFPVPEVMTYSEMTDGSLKMIDMAVPMTLPGRHSGKHKGALMVNHSDDLSTVPSFISLGFLKAYLTDTVEQAIMAPPPGQSIISRDALYVPDARPGIGVDENSSIVRSGAYFSRAYRRYRASKHLGVARKHPFVSIQSIYQTMATINSLPNDSKRALAFLGGDRRRALISMQEWCIDEVSLGADLITAVQNKVPGSSGLFLYTLTPTIVQDSWAIEVSGNSIDPFALAAGKPRRISGWDSANRCPRPLLTTFPEGSVWYYEWPDDMTAETKKETIDQYWLSSLNRTGAVAGFGRVLVGVWS